MVDLQGHPDQKPKQGGSTLASAIPGGLINKASQWQQQPGLAGSSPPWPLSVARPALERLGSIVLHCSGTGSSSV